MLIFEEIVTDSTLLKINVKSTIKIDSSNLPYIFTMTRKKTRQTGTKCELQYGILLALSFMLV